MKTPKSGAKAPMASAKRKAAKPKSAAKAKKVQELDRLVFLLALKDLKK